MTTSPMRGDMAHQGVIGYLVSRMTSSRVVKTPCGAPRNPAGSRAIELGCGLLRADSRKRGQAPYSTARIVSRRIPGGVSRGRST
jgi:hypothetical protein